MPTDTDHLWYKDAIFYELHVRAFYDSNADGVGDFPGATYKLDYLKDLGITCIWLLPFYQSPLKDDGYDISDYYRVLPEYGTLQDFQRFIDAAHQRGIRVIADLVVNHTSDQHPWFLEARSSPTSSRREYYVWSDTDQKYQEARIIFRDSEKSNWTYDPVARAYYWHRFFHHQPDLNYDNPDVQRTMFDVVRFWLEMGLDGFRCDAAPHLFEREGTSCEGMPETHAYFRALRREIDRSFPDRILLAEANQWPADVRAYFGAGDEFHMAFHFPLMPRLFMALRREERQPIVDILEQTPALPDTCQWGAFLRNHDEMTLEMCTDEERDYMYHEYARDPRMRLNAGIRRRLAPLMDNGRRQIELMYSLLFTLPGSPVIYYGDEIGMGDNIYLGDRNGVRTPMQWSGDRNAGFSQADPERLYFPVILNPVYHYQAVNVEAQLRTDTSLLRWLQRLIAIRKRYPVFSRGSLIMLHPANKTVFAFLRQYHDDTVLLVHNLSRFAQPVELDLQVFQGATPIEMIGNTPFPPIREQRYCLSLGPHDCYWFRLDPGSTKEETRE
jgi:maltose alpha-D-glucosyltransferase/alpha-amylase